MKKLILLALLFFSSPALAQPILCPDQPLGNSTNACANTRFVIANAGSGGTSTLSTNHIFIGNGSNIATDTAMTGDCSIVFAGGAITCTKSSGNTILSMAFQASSAVSITGGTITGMPTPTNASDVAIKSYVDSVASGRTPLAPVRLATTAVLSNTPTYANGAAGVGATLTAGSNGVLSVDSTVVNSADRVLVKDQAAPLQNGCYTLTTVGTVSVAYILTRCTDADTAAEMPNGLTGLVNAGTVNIGTSWTLNQPAAITVGTTALPWVQTGSSTVSYWTLSGSDIHNNNGGLVGINNATPIAQLDIQSSSAGAPQNTLFRSGGNTTSDSPIVGWSRLNGTIDLALFGNANGSRIKSSSSLAFHTSDTGVSATNQRMTIDASGLVGIGTATPTSILDVNFSGAALQMRDSSTPGNNTLLQASSFFGPIIAGHTDAAGNSTFNAPSQMLGLGGSGFQIFNSPTTAVSSPRTWTQRVTLDANSNLGIAVTSPAAGATLQVGNATSNSIYVNSVNPTLQQAVCYGFFAGNCETDGFLSHLKYTSAATTTGAAVRGEVLMEKAGATALGTTGVASNLTTGVNAELVGVIGVADWNGAGTGTAVWAITEGTGATAGATHAFEGTNGGTFTPTWGLLIGKEGVATQSFHIGGQFQDTVDYGVVVGGAGTSLVPTTPYAYINTAGTTLFFVDNAGVVHGASDSRLKNDLGLMPSGALQRISMLIPRNFTRKDDTTSRLESGFFAQEVRFVIPEAVTEGDDGMLSLTQGPLIANLVGAIKELKADNDNLRACQATWKCRIFGWR